MSEHTCGECLLWAKGGNCVDINYNWCATKEANTRYNNQECKPRAKWREAEEEIERLKAENTRLRQERYDALGVKSKEGLTSSEWLLRTGIAERKQKELKAELESRKLIITNCFIETHDKSDKIQMPFGDTWPIVIDNYAIIPRDKHDRLLREMEKVRAELENVKGG